MSSSLANWDGSQSTKNKEKATAQSKTLSIANALTLLVASDTSKKALLNGSASSSYLFEERTLRGSEDPQGSRTRMGGERTHKKYVPERCDFQDLEGSMMRETVDNASSTCTPSKLSPNYLSTYSTLAPMVQVIASQKTPSHSPLRVRSPSPNAHSRPSSDTEQVLFMGNAADRGDRFPSADGDVDAADADRIEQLLRPSPTSSPKPPQPPRNLCTTSVAGVAASNRSSLPPVPPADLDSLFTPPPSPRLYSQQKAPVNKATHSSTLSSATSSSYSITNIPNSQPRPLISPKARNPPTKFTLHFGAAPTSHTSTSTPSSSRTNQHVVHTPTEPQNPKRRRQKTIDPSLYVGDVPGAGSRIYLAYVLVPPLPKDVTQAHYHKPLERVCHVVGNHSIGSHSKTTHSMSSKKLLPSTSTSASTSGLKLKQKSVAVRVNGNLGDALNLAWEHNNAEPYHGVGVNAHASTSGSRKAAEAVYMRGASPVARKRKSKGFLDESSVSGTKKKKAKILHTPSIAGTPAPTGTKGRGKSNEKGKGKSESKSANDELASTSKKGSKFRWLAVGDALHDEKRDVVRLCVGDRESWYLREGEGTLERRKAMEAVKVSNTRFVRRLKSEGEGVRLKSLGGTKLTRVGSGLDLPFLRLSGREERDEGEEDEDEYCLAGYVDDEEGEGQKVYPASSSPTGTRNSMAPPASISTVSTVSTKPKLSAKALGKQKAPDTPEIIDVDAWYASVTSPTSSRAPRRDSLSPPPSPPPESVHREQIFHCDSLPPELDYDDPSLSDALMPDSYDAFMSMSHDSHAPSPVHDFDDDGSGATQDVPQSAFTVNPRNLTLVKTTFNENCLKMGALGGAQLGRFVHKDIYFGQGQAGDDDLNETDPDNDSTAAAATRKSSSHPYVTVGSLADVERDPSMFDQFSEWIVPNPDASLGGLEPVSGHGTTSSSGEASRDSPFLAPELTGRDHDPQGMGTGTVNPLALFAFDDVVRRQGVEENEDEGMNVGANDSREERPLVPPSPFGLSKRTKPSVVLPAGSVLPHRSAGRIVHVAGKLEKEESSKAKSALSSLLAYGSDEDEEGDSDYEIQQDVIFSDAQDEEYLPGVELESTTASTRSASPPPLRIPRRHYPSQAGPSATPTASASASRSQVLDDTSLFGADVGSSSSVVAPVVKSDGGKGKGKGRGKGKTPWATGSKDLWCHQCRTRSFKLHMSCATDGCSKNWCIKCISVRYTHITFDEARKDFVCPLCQGNCCCDQCCRRRGVTYIPSRGGVLVPEMARKYPPESSQPREPRVRTQGGGGGGRKATADPHSHSSRCRSKLGGKTNLPPIMATERVTRPVQYYGAIYDLQGQTIAGAYVTDFDHADVILARPLYPQNRPKEKVKKVVQRKRVFVGDLQPCWGLGDHPRVGLEKEEEGSTTLAESRGTRKIREFIGRRPLKVRKSLGTDNLDLDPGLGGGVREGKDEEDGAWARDSTGEDWSLLFNVDSPLTDLGDDKD